MRAAHGTALVVERELREALRRRSFWLIAGIALLASTAGMVLPELVGDDGPTRYDVAVVDATPSLQAALHEVAPNLPPSLFGITSHAEPSTLFALGGEIRFLRRGEDAARFLRDGPGRVVAVGDRALDDFRREAAALPLAPPPARKSAGHRSHR